MVSDCNLTEQKFSRLIGLPIWGGKKGIGTFLTFEFGSPRIIIREPIVASKIPQLMHRKITIAGEWHLWIENAYWEIKNKFYHYQRDQIELLNKVSDYSDFDECLNLINGQIVTNVELNEDNCCITLKFDLGGFMKFWQDKSNRGAQWSFFNFDKCIASCEL